MNCDNGNCSACKTAGIFASVILAIAAGVLSYFGFFAFPGIGFIAALILGFLSAAGLIAGMSIRRREGGAFSCCLCKNSVQILVGAVGSFLFALASLVIGTAVGTLITAVLTAITALFFLLLVSGIVCFALCITKTCG